ncbi:MAG: cyclic pyranopterin monophosphate synthase MoaC [Candidatus Glassbacteria bacterium]
MKGDAKVKMVDVSGKEEAYRTSISSGRITMNASTLELVKGGKVEKGDVLSVAHVAAIHSAKMTPYLVPLCHPLNITWVDVRFIFEDNPPSILVRTSVNGHDRTGFEMESMTATTVALLTIYDMLKPLDDSMEIGSVRLEAKSGGKSGDWRRSRAQEET